MTRLLPVWLAVAASLPGLICALAGFHLAPPLAALLSGAAILAASFILLWACDVAQNDIPQALALAVVALIAVLPEYAVDMYFTWMAGQNPQSDYAHFAIANMTGANRLLIGVAWTAVAIIVWWRTRGPVLLGPERRIEVLFLGLATVYAMSIPLTGSLTWVDGVVLMAFMSSISPLPPAGNARNRNCAAWPPFSAPCPPRSDGWPRRPSFSSPPA